MDVTYVSAFYQIYDEIKDEYLDDYIKFVEKGFPCILFLDKNLPQWLEKLNTYKNMTVVSTMGFDDLPLTKQKPKETTKLAEHRNTVKDTYEYMILMNSKLYFLKEALAKTTSDNFAWIDFGIRKILKHPDDSFKRLEFLKLDEQKILIPGCYDEPRSVDTNSVHWRFCGGLFFGKRNAIQSFITLSDVVLADLPNLTWEVNVWALAEQINTGLFKWYKADHNDSILSFPISGDRKIILTIMIKNEERIIKRCISNALNIADAVCISDTGSTDNTLKILEEFLPTISIPSKVVNHTWENFGKNRTESFQSAQAYCNELGWNPETTYSLLLDADMNFVMTPAFQKSSLIANGYCILQKNPNLEYYNTRLIKIGFPWKCVGVTHEYWDGENTAQLNTLYIDDIGDGGCKNDKFTRDERLLRQGLIDEPNNGRYMFYLAQTLKDLKKLPESIDMYKKRAEAGGWFEETWYSMYVISKLYYELGNLTEMEYWALRAYDLNKNRIENIFFLTKVFREKGQYHKAWHYLMLGINVKKPNELLFLEPEIYEHLFYYEKTILNYYIQSTKHKESLLELISYYNVYGGNIYSNLKFYVQQIKLKSERLLNFEQTGDYVATSTSICRQEENYRLNVRYVNYRIQPDGSYLMMQDGVLSRDHNVKTRNFTVLVDSDFQMLSDLEEMKPDFPQKHNVHIQGLEDLRIYQEGDFLKWAGTSMEYSHDGKIRQIMGLYDTDSKLLKDAVSLIPPTDSDCEKNWIPLGNDEFIYGWKPYRVGVIKDSKFVTTMAQNTPRYFENVRGSSNVVEYKSALWTLTHVVMYSTPRKYYHHLMKLNKQTRRIEAFSLPFFFKTNHIEYCLGIEMRNETLMAIVSQNDANPVLCTIQLSDLTFNKL